MRFSSALDSCPGNHILIPDILRIKILCWAHSSKLSCRSLFLCTQHNSSGGWPCPRTPIHQFLPIVMPLTNPRLGSYITGPSLTTPGHTLPMTFYWITSIWMIKTQCLPSLTDLIKMVHLVPLKNYLLLFACGWMF